MGHIYIDMPNTDNKWVEFGLANVDIFIIRIGFGLMNINAIHILIRYEYDLYTRIDTPRHRKVRWSFVFLYLIMNKTFFNLMLKSN